MGTIAENGYNRSMSFIKLAMSTLTKWLQELGQYLEKASEYAPYKKLAKAIQANGGHLYEIQCPSGTNEKFYCDEIKRELTKRGIAFFNMTNNDKRIFVDPNDLETIKEINREVLIAQCNYFQEIDTNEMENAIASQQLIKNKEMVTFHGLNDYELEVFKNKCNAIQAGFMVGIEEDKEHPGKHNMTVHSQNMFKMLNKEGKSAGIDVCRAYTEAIFSLYGQNSFTKVAQIDADKEVREQIKSLMESGESFYVVDARNPKVFLEINSNGLEFYENVLGEDNQLHQKQISKTLIDDADFDYELEKCLDSLNNKAIIHTQAELGEHMSTKAVNVDYLRPDKTPEEERISMAEDLIVEQMDKSIKENMEKNGIRFDNSKSIFDQYQGEVMKLIEAANERRDVPGYKSEDIKKIREIAENAGLDLGIYAKQFRAKTENLTVDVHQAKKMLQKEIDERRADRGNINPDR